MADLLQQRTLADGSTLKTKGSPAHPKTSKDSDKSEPTPATVLSPLDAIQPNSGPAKRALMLASPRSVAGKNEMVGGDVGRFRLVTSKAARWVGGMKILSSVFALKVTMASEQGQDCLRHRSIAPGAASAIGGQT
eukprot:123483-Rhodomonas_salina.1